MVAVAFGGGRALRACGALVLTLALVLSLSVASSTAAAPSGFFGITAQSLSAPDFARMEGIAGTVRVAFDWSQIEPRPGSYDFAATDELVGEAADHRVRVRPYVYGTPRWLTADPAQPPLATARERTGWAAFLRRLVARYGPGGNFWEGRTRRAPIVAWQIWNEPNFLLFWRPRPAPAGYARLLAISARAIRREDRNASIVTAGVAPVEAGMLPWAFLERMYRVPGVRRSFDAVGLHPYGGSVEATALPGAPGQARDGPKRRSGQATRDHRAWSCLRRSLSECLRQGPTWPGALSAARLPVPARAPASLANLHGGLVHLARCSWARPPLRLLSVRRSLRCR
ncbi:MAG TPA: hypothetical protein VLK89_03725 [Solirubrobacterales bacterium]|nr:hypothetical protein [Solirubrobacterales bacterium]